MYLSISLHWRNLNQHYHFTQFCFRNSYANLPHFFYVMNFMSSYACLIQVSVSSHVKDSISTFFWILQKKEYYKQ